MFQLLGKTVVRAWPCFIVGWIVLIIGVVAVTPEWDSVTDDGEFAYLPEDAPSRQAEQLFQKAFPDDLLASSIVIVVRRESYETGLLDKDKDFILQVTFTLPNGQRLTDDYAL